MSDWQPIETCPQDGFFLVSEDGAIRTAMRHKGVFESPDFPILIKDQNRLIPREVKHHYGWDLELCGCSCLNPSHWMELPEPPK